MLEPGFYNMDCMDGMREFPCGYFDLAIVDPPYGLDKFSLSQGGGKLRHRAFNRLDTSWDTAPPQEYFAELFRVSKNQIIFGGNYFDLPPTRGFVVWDKKQGFQTFSQAEYIWTSFYKPSKVFEYRPGTKGKTVEQKIHPTQKPIALYEFLLGTFAHDGDKILDTHVGSASSLIACQRAGFEYYGFEIDPYYYEKAKERLDKEKTKITIWESNNA